jgi:1-deoxy-D-xylulose-5-phosphate synthase
MHKVEIGKGERLAQGNDIAILSVGPIAYEVSLAIEKAKEHGISVAHYDMVYIKPIDENLMNEVASLNCPIITVEDGVIDGGFGSAVLEWLNDNNHYTKVKRIGVPDKFIHQGTVKQQYQICGMDSESIYNTILSLTAN